MRKFIIFLFLLFAKNAIAQSLYFPPISGSTWDTTSASSLGWCTGAPLDSLYSFLNYRNTKGFILLKDGKIVLEKYYGTFTKDSNWYWASAGKTLVAFTVGIAQENNLLNIHDKTLQYLGNGWSSCTSLQEDSITLLHQLTMTTGLDDNVPDDNCVIDTCLKYLVPVDTRWAYYNASYRLLQDVVDSASSAPSFNSYVSQMVRNKIGMNGIFFNNINYSTTRSMARFGLLLLAKGTWDATKVLADTNYLHNMTNTSQQLNKAYGYLTWLNGKTDYMIPQTQIVFSGKLMPNAPDDMYAALGKDGQLINVVPSKNLVLIRLGNNPNDGGIVTTVFNNDIWKYLKDVMCTPNAINNISAQAEWQVAPNPATEKIIISGSNLKNKKMQLINLQGQIMVKMKLENSETTIVTNSLPKGIYIIKIGDEYKKIVLE